MAQPRRLLVIAGSDSSGGAGIQADIKTACAFGVYAMTAVTAVTAQDTTGVHSIHLLPASLVRMQVSCCLSDIGADAIKIGMLGSADIAEAVADVLERDAHGIPLVLDPVLASTSGTPLLDAAGIEILKSRLIPLATLVTPNIPEAEMLTGVQLRQDSSSSRQNVMARPCELPRLSEQAARKLMGMGARSVLVKGGHSTGAMVEDVLLREGGIERFEFPRIDTRSTHGTGCTLATAIACGLAQGLPLLGSVRRARAFGQAAIATAPGFGRGHGPINHLQSP